MDEFLKEVFSKHGVPSLLGGFIAVLLVWIVAHKISEPNTRVSVFFGVVGYTKASAVSPADVQTPVKDSPSSDRSNLPGDVIGIIEDKAVPGKGENSARLTTSVDEDICQDYSGIWTNVDNSGANIGTMKLQQDGCYVVGDIEGDIEGEFFQRAKGWVIKDTMELDIQRIHGACLNILKVIAKPEPGLKSRIRMETTNILGSCNEVVPGLQLPAIVLEKF